MRGFNSDEAMNRPVLGTVRVMEDGNIRWSYVSVWAHDGLRSYIWFIPGCITPGWFIPGCI